MIALLANGSIMCMQRAQLKSARQPTTYLPICIVIIIINPNTTISLHQHRDHYRQGCFVEVKTIISLGGLRTRLQLPGLLLVFKRVRDLSNASYQPFLG